MSLNFENKKCKVQTLAIVPPRYGLDLGGGAEALCRSLIENSNFDRVEVWTTCARDHRTWENFYSPGHTVENGINVHRFPVDQRDLEVFISAEHAIAQGRPLSVSEQLDWLANSVNSKALYSHIAENADIVDAIVFAPYLFATSFWGSLIRPEKSVLLPCLHNENYAYLPVFDYLFSKVRGLIFNASAEKDLAFEIFGSEVEGKSAVVGMGFDKLEEEPLQSLGRDKPFILYSGRKERGKNLDLLIEYFSHYKQETSSKLELLMIGAGEIDFIDQLPEGVVDLGFVSEEAKESLMRAALVLCQPSVNESFSIVIMEAWLRGTAVLVHGGSAVTREHVVKSGGGLFFSSKDEFIKVLEYLESESAELCRMATAGKIYVEEQYSYEAVNQRLVSSFDKFFSEDCSQTLIEA